MNSWLRLSGKNGLPHDLAIGSEDCSRFFMELIHANDLSPNITAKSKGKLIRNTVATLQDFGLVVGTKHRTISRPPIVPRTAFHLTRLLFMEGLSGKEIMQARDWRLFLWDQPDISRMMNRMAQEKWIRYEKSGQIVILEIENESLP